jgi:hypothetical protein
MATRDTLQREVLPIPDRKPVSLTTYEAICVSFLVSSHNYQEGNTCSASGCLPLPQ